MWVRKEICLNDILVEIKEEWVTRHDGLVARALAC